MKITNLLNLFKQEQSPIQDTPKEVNEIINSFNVVVDELNARISFDEANIAHLEKENESVCVMCADGIADVETRTTERIKALESQSEREITRLTEMRDTRSNEIQNEIKLKDDGITLARKIKTNIENLLK